MGRWDKLKERYEKAPLRAEEGYRDRLSETIANHSGKTIAELTAAYREARDTKEEHEEAIKGLNLELEALSQLLIEKLEQQDLTSIKTDEGHTFTVKTEPYPSVFDRGILEEHIEKHPELDYLYSVHPSSLSALVKDLLDSGRDAEVPAGVKIFLKSIIQMRRSKE